MASLSDFAELITSGDRDNQVVTVSVRDEGGNQVYTGTLTFAGSGLGEAARS
jgi:hypothetical protein